jgi:hypothetical protein
MNRWLWSILLIFCEQGIGAPLLTITCEPPTGISLQYGVSSFDQMAAMQANQSLPTRQDFGEPVKDGYERKAIFVVQSAELITVMWQESAREIKLKESRKNQGLKELAKAPEAEEAKIVVNLSPISITAVQDSGFQTKLYTFYPKDGIVFISEHHKDIGSKAIWARALHSRCEFSGTLLR